MIRKVMILALFLISVIFASASVFQEGSTGTLGEQTGNDFKAYSWNLVNPVIGSNYSSCPLPAAKSNSLSAASIFDTATYGTNQDLIIMFRTSTVEIYDYNCNLVHTINKAPVSNGVIMNVDADAYSEIVFIASDGLNVWEFNESSGGMSMILNNAAGGTYTRLGCTRATGSPFRCLAFKNGVSSQIAYTLAPNIITNSTFNSGAAPLADNVMTGLSFARYDTANQLEVLPYCAFTTSNTRVSCQFFNQNGAVIGRVNTTTCTPGTVAASISIQAAHYTKPGGVGRITSAVTWVSDSGTRCANFIMTDETGTLYKQDQLNTISNIVVGNFQKSSGKMACYLGNSSNSYLFRCYDSNGNSKYNINVTGVINSSHIVMADFVPTSNFLSIGTTDGIYSFNGAVFSKVYDTGYADYAIAASKIETTQAASTSAPAYIVSSLLTSFVMKDITGSLSCGNNICSPDETAWNCPADCGNTTNECVSDANCAALYGSLYPSCLAYRCVGGVNSSLPCAAASDCPYEYPICYQNLCIQRASPGTDTGAQSDVISQNNEFQSFMDILFQGSSWLKFIVGMIIIIVIAAEAGNLSYGNPFVITLGAFIGLILVTVLGLVPIFVLVLTILVLVLLLIFNRVIFPNVGVSK